MQRPGPGTEESGLSSDPRQQRSYPREPPGSPSAPSDLEGAALACAALRPPGSQSADLWQSISDNSSIQLLRPPLDPSSADREDGFAPLPEVGRPFLGFTLLAELGRGTFGRVYLGRQGDLADRLVALKVSTDTVAESQMLARLQHTNIVPVYSLHRAGPLLAVCMPYFGATTLADVLQDLGQRDTLPASGRGLVTTLEDRRSRTRASLDEGNLHRTPAPLPPRPPSENAQSMLRHLEGLTYVEAILWIGSCLADGLTHAHERGILHRDLKPANVLLTDEGQPMLLDFNLAIDLEKSQQRSGHIGGTLPYMAPEHLAAFGGMAAPFDSTRRPAVDERSDIYSLGLLLFELLTGRPPFPRRPGSPDQAIPQMIADRLPAPPCLIPHNPTVSPAVEAIVRHCLQADPRKRYASARHLREDLDRQLAHEPLLHIREPSLQERFQKWSRRHPRLASTTSVVVLTTILIVTLFTALFTRSKQLAGFEAQARLAHFRGHLHEARLLLAAGPGEPSLREEGKDVAQRALAIYGMPGEAGWADRPAIQLLNDEDRQYFPSEMGELLLLLAGASEPGEAWPLNEAALVCFRQNEPPRAWFEQRAGLLDRLGRREEAPELRLRAASIELRGSWDRYLLAAEHARRGAFSEAIPLLQRAVADDPENFAAWFLLGNCCLNGLTDPIGREAEAVGHFTACLALRSRFHGAWYNRGLAYLRLGRWGEAERDFTRALELRAGWREALVSRSLAREGRGGLREAVADLDRALEKGPSTRAQLARARVRAALGDTSGARQDLQDALTHEPTTEEDWIARGVARVTTDARAALADFAEAVRLQPRSLAGWQNQAHVLSEHMGRTREALLVLDRMSTLHPEYLPARASRAVLRARLGQRDEALRDARDTLARAGKSAELRFQLAGVWALTSVMVREDRDEAFRLLAQALRAGHGHDLLETDPDLAPLREDARYRSLLRATKSLSNQATENSGTKK